MDALWKSVRFAVRMLKRTPARRLDDGDGEVVRTSGDPAALAGAASSRRSAASR